MKSYTHLKSSMLKLFANKNPSHREAVAKFETRQQESDENLHQYYATLSSLSKESFPTLSKNQRLEYVGERFIDGILNDALKVELSKYISTDFNYKKLLEYAAKMEPVFMRSVTVNKIHINRLECPCKTNCFNKKSQGNIIVRCTLCQKKKQQTKLNCDNLTKTALYQNKQCFKCQQFGHLRRDCVINTTKLHIKPLVKLNKCVKNWNVPLSVQEEVEKLSKANGIYGTALVDGIATKFLADTGSPRSLINAKLLSKQQLQQIRPANFNVQTANGELAHVAGVKTSEIRYNGHSMFLDILVCHNLSEQCIMGLDFLIKSPSTKQAISILANAINHDSHTTETKPIFNEEGRHVLSSHYSF